jgi:Tol biopolymer transport system component
MKHGMFMTVIKLMVGVFTLIAFHPFPSQAASPDPQELAYIENARQLTLAGRRSGEGYFSKDGTQLVFQSERDTSNPFFQIFNLDLTTGDIHRVSPGTGKTTCSYYHPDGKRILFASTHHDPKAIEKQKEELEMRAGGQERRYAWDYDDTMDIFLANKDGSDVQPLTRERGYDAEGSFSPDGKWIAFCSFRHAFPLNQLSQEDQKRYEIDPSYFGDIYIMKSDGSDVKRLTNHPGYDGGPFFSPDGKRIVWRRFDKEGVNADIMTMNLDGGDVRQITKDYGMAWAPYFHPSNEYIIFTTNKEGFSNFELYVVDRLGYREPVRVSFTDGFDGLPVFSPDGNRLVWTSNRYAQNPGSKDKGQLFMANWNHEAVRAALRRSPVRQAETQKATQKSVKRASDYGDIPVLEGGPGRDPGRAIERKESTLSPQITEKDLQQHVRYLASDELEGRLTGEKGARMAAEYIAKSLKEIGIQPYDNQEGFYQSFEFSAGVEVDESGTFFRFETSNSAAESNQAAQVLSVQDHFSPLAFSENGQFKGDIVFAGYGLKVPGEGAEGYNSYAGLNVSNKVAMVLRYVPEGVDNERRALLNRYSSLRYKALIARELGASGLLVVTGPNSPNSGKLIPLQSDQSLGNSGILAGSITEALADQLLAGTGKTLKVLQDGLDQENPHAVGTLEIPETMVEFAVKLNRIRKADRNVIGLLHPPHSSSSAKEYIVLGAHYDHLGYGEHGGFQVKGEENQIHNGADDNASGVAAVLEVAGAVKQFFTQSPEKVERGVIFAFWSGEELGLIGSSHFANHPPLPLNSMKAYLNFDMVGRLRDNKLTLQGLGSSADWKMLIEKRNILAGFQLSLQEDPYLPTDTTAFYPKEIPVLSFFTGSHDEYHRPGDDIVTLNWNGLQRISSFAKSMVLDLVNRDNAPLQYSKVAPSKQQGNRDTLRVYLGTIPDYTTEVVGVKLTGVRSGGPADKAGLKPDDVITSLAGQPIKNIYDYTYALDAIKIGESTEISVLRSGKPLTLKIIPTARP